MLFDHTLKGQCVYDQQGLLKDVWSNESRLSGAKCSLICDVTDNMLAGHNRWPAERLLPPRY